MKKITIGERSHTVYSVGEADERGIEYVYWKEATREDSHALTDDGYVLEIHKIQTYKSDSGNERDIITFGGARKWVTGSAELNWEVYRETGNYTAVNPRSSWEDREAGTKRVQRAIDVMVASFMATGSYDWKRAGEVYRPDQKVPEATLKRLFHKEKFRNMLQDKLKEKYEELGFNEEWVVENIMEAALIAKRENDALNLIRASEKGIKLLAMEPGRVKETTEQTADVSEHVLSDAKEYRAKLSQRTITEKPEDSPSVSKDPQEDEGQPGEVEDVSD